MLAERKVADARHKAGHDDEDPWIASLLTA
jgi:hypothetical protein